MDLSYIQNLPTQDKLTWLQSPDGSAQLQEWLSAGISQRQIAKMLGVDSKTIYRWRDHYLAEIIAPYLPATQGKAVSLARPAAYRIIAGYNHNTLRQYQERGCTVLCEFDTASAVWDSEFITNYFKSFGVPKADYLSDFLQKIRRDSVYHLSNLYSIAYTDVTLKGVLRVLKGGAPKA